ncbi:MULTISPECIES: NADP-dependent oxidoreductase [Streptomycetaceae]|nr:MULTISPECIES: NADP-dependent oxidoreductase [Streptomycetaceae]MYS58655.1 zinc-binding dehydrogenase [Streptomyces sp. SID5468]CCB74325.1 Zn-dependent oxidoreductase, NADPH:quinone reductase [Streptantibioticus cattleyicolor NRRL 8057 = DSM 46488]
MNAIRFHEYGEATDVLRLERADVPVPGPGEIRVAVHACGLNPADWALCRGLFTGQLPRGIGLEVSGTVDAVGAGVTGVAVGDTVLGAADYAGGHSAGAADFAVLTHWAHVPEGLDLVQAAALPMAVETAYRSLEQLAVTAGRTLLVHGAGTMIGFAAVQIALDRGARVIAAAGPTYAERLRALGATVTSYGDGMAERVTAAAGGPVDLVLDTAPPGGVLPALVRVADGDPRRVLTVSDPDGVGLGVRTSFDEDASKALRYDVLGEFAQRAAEGRFSIPVARVFPLADWRTAAETSLGGRARGKLVLLLDRS